MAKRGKRELRKSWLKTEVCSRGMSVYNIVAVCVSTSPASFSTLIQRCRVIQRSLYYPQYSTWRLVPPLSLQSLSLVSAEEQDTQVSRALSNAEPSEYTNPRESTGSTTCDSGLICFYYNDFYSQCQKPATSTSAASTTSKTSSVPISTTSWPPPSLDAHVKGLGLKYWGVVVDPTCLSNSQCSAIVKADFGSVTPENTMKWDAMYVVSPVVIVRSS